MNSSPSLVPGRLWVASINLTENLEFVRVHPAWSLEKLTQWGLPYLCTWVRDLCPGSATGSRRRLHLGRRVCWRPHRVELEAALGLMEGAGVELGVTEAASQSRPAT